LSDLIQFIEQWGDWAPLGFLGLFALASALTIWRLNAMTEYGFQGTALGTLVMPFCSGLGNLIFVYIIAERDGPAQEVFINALVNNTTNLTLLIGLPALLWGLQVMPGAGGGKEKKPAKAAKGGGNTEQQINRLSLLLTLAAVLFFTGAVWLLGRDGKLNQTDGFVLIGLFLFWQCVQVFDVLKNNVRHRVSFGWKFYLDGLIVLACAYLMYETIDWLVTWLSAQKHGFISRDNLGWLTGWLMVLPNAVLALYWGWRRRADVVYSSQVGDGHICIPLCLGLFALVKPLPISAFNNQALFLLLGSAGLHVVFLLTNGGLPRWAGGVLCLAYGWFVYAGLVG